MTPGEIKALVKTLRAAGVTHYKTPEIELSFSIEAPNSPPPERSSKQIVPPDAPISKDDPIMHKVEQMVSVMKLEDNELIERLFPNPEEEKAEVVQ